MVHKRISILGMGWLGLPLGAQLVQLGHTVKGTTTRSEKLAKIRNVGAEAFLLQAGPELPDQAAPDFFATDVLVLTLPPSSVSPGGRRTTHPPDGRYRDTLQRILDQIPTDHDLRIIYTSSTSVYGEQVGKVNEESPLGARTTSAQMVVQAEELLQIARPGQVSILRLGGLVGADRQPGRYFAGRQGLPQGKAPVNMVQQVDCIRAIATLIEKEAWGKTFNLVAPQHPSRAEYYRKRIQNLGLDPAEFDPEDHSMGKKVSSALIQQELGYEFLYPDPMSFPS